MIYFDTSYLLKCYLAEPGHQRVRTLARQQGPVACCALGKTEWHAGVHRHVREGKLTAAQAALVYQVMQADDAAGLWTWLPLSEAVIGAASREFDLNSTVVVSRCRRCSPKPVSWLPRWHVVGLGTQ